jgi:hypothetical protein
MVDFGIGFLANGRNDDGEALRARRIQQQKRKAPVAGD